MTVHAGVDRELAAMMRTVFADHDSSNDRSADLDLDHALWRTLAQLGLTGLVSSEGGTWTDSVALLRAAAGSHAAVPLAEHDLLAQWLRSEAGLSLQQGPSTVCVLTDPEDRPATTWASQVDRLVVLSCLDGAARVTEFETSTLRMDPGRDVAGAPQDRVDLRGVPLDGPLVDAELLDELRLRRALAKSAQMSGAMRAAVELSREYALQRHQFGRPIARFQAVQHLFVQAAAESELAGAAVDAAAAVVDEHGFDGEQAHDAVAVAASVCAHAATVVCRNSHQVHGAIGMTLELPLHRVTRPLLAWRSELGGSREWEQRLGRRLVDGSGPAWFTATA